MSKETPQKYRWVTQKEVIREGDQVLVHGEYQPVAVDLIGQVIDFINPIRRPVTQDNEDICDIIDDKAQFDEGNGNEYWVEVDADTPTGRAMPVADAEKQAMGYYAYRTPDGVWRNAHNKEIVVTPSWYLAQWPDFPGENEPELPTKVYNEAEATSEKVADSSDYKERYMLLRLQLLKTADTMKHLVEVIEQTVTK